MLEHKVIVYDDNCPMCKLYTQGFVRLGILTLEHRVGFAHAPSDYTALLDLNRARHEIPLLDTLTGEVTYGMDALFLLIGHRLPFLRPLFRSPRFRALVYSLYQIVTYNRRVIAGCAAPREGFNCAPDFHRPMRLRYLRLALVSWALLLGGVAVSAWFARQPLLLALLLIGAGVQALRWRLPLRSRCAWDRLGGLATNNLLFALLLIPSLLPLPAPARWANLLLAGVVTLLDALRRQRNCRNCLACQKLHERVNIKNHMDR